MASKRKAPKLMVMFDTNIIHYVTESDLFKPPIEELLKKESTRSDINIKWYLPDIVVKERRYQMQKTSLELLPNLRKLEKVLAHKLNITEDILFQRIEDRIEEQIKLHKINILVLDVGLVDWNHTIEQSCYRKPPFSKGEKEKGFRDAMIGETFFQLIRISPKSSNENKIVFVTGDGPLKDHILEITNMEKGVHVLSLEELIELINTLASNIDEQTIKQYQSKAKKYFFDETATKDKSLYYRENIGERIRDSYQSKLNYYPPEIGTARKNVQWIINPPRFEKKERETLTWTTKVVVEGEVTRTEFRPSNSSYPLINGPGQLLTDLMGSKKPDLWTSQIPNIGVLNVSNPSEAGGISIQPPITRVTATIRSVFEINWSLNIKGSKLSRPKINIINHLETIWDVN